MKTGFVTILGRPNVGKSTLLNAIMEYKVSITSDKPQTTRDQIRGIYNDEDSQIVFIDTPGIHKPKQKLGESLNNASYKALEDVDIVLFLQPADEKIGPGDRLILDKIKNYKNKIAIITKVDIESDPILLKEKAEELKTCGFDLVLGTAPEFKGTINSLIKELKDRLPEGAKYYEEDQLTDKSMRFIAKEIIRESAIKYLQDELPHSLGVEIMEFKEGEEKDEIQARIYCERPSQKGIIVGHQGKMIKKIGTTARKRISYAFDKRIHLELKVKVNKNWTEDEIKIKQMGY
ncbi:GTPase Era [Mycoplasma marinum]|uniref:GTPase Era n=1 Tax=Mycoplasma marinum TaxID=1937190 RepID=A0A4R0XQG1_9MOLU|nr:GTPase Era [Mycoplasma marinum]TCG11115.1 GTPase Era [Mycoplasma marinum]